MSHDSAPRIIQLILACDAPGAAADLLAEAMRVTVGTGLPLTIAADEAAVLRYRALAVDQQRRIALVPTMPGSKEPASLESRLDACRTAAGEVHAVYLPVGGTLHGAIADLKRLALHAVIDAHEGRRALPGHVSRQGVDAIVPAAGVIRQLFDSPSRAIRSGGLARATVVVSLAHLAGGGYFARRQVRGVLATLRAMHASGSAEFITTADVATTAHRRATPQQSIMRAA